VAIGTSLPELAASVAAARKNEHDLAVGNIIGSNLFNTLAVVGLAGSIQPMQAPAEVLSRDWPLMFALTVLLLVIGYVQKSKPISQITRIGGFILLAIYIVYTAYLMRSALV